MWDFCEGGCFRMEGTTEILTGSQRQVFSFQRQQHAHMQVHCGLLGVSFIGKCNLSADSIISCF